MEIKKCRELREVDVGLWQGKFIEDVEKEIKVKVKTRKVLFKNFTIRQQNDKIPTQGDFTLCRADMFALFDGLPIAVSYLVVTAKGGG